MFNKNNFCHVASNNRNEQKAGIFVYKTTDNLQTVSQSGYFNDKIIDINLHDLIIHEQTNNADKTKVGYNILAVTERTLTNVGTTVIKRDWDVAIETAIAELQTYVDETFVRKDGTSVMTGPLKFTAGSMRGAIAGGLNGVTFFKMDSEGNLTQIGSLSDTQFVPGADNTLDIGTTVRKVERIYLGKVNNGYDIDVPVTSSSDTLALKSQVDDAANSGEQLYTTGVWYAKMYAATTVPTGSEYEGRNYADFSQVDQDNKPIIVVYTYTSGSWTQTASITPPKNHNGYMTITSKIWDIAEQSGQQGGLVLWSHNQETFTPYPKIISFENAALTGNSTTQMPVNPTNDTIINKAYLDAILAGIDTPELFDYKWKDCLTSRTTWALSDGNWIDDKADAYAQLLSEWTDDMYALFIQAGGITYNRYSGFDSADWFAFDAGGSNISYATSKNPAVNDYCVLAYYNASTTSASITSVDASGIHLQKAGTSVDLDGLFVRTPAEDMGTLFAWKSTNYIAFTNKETVTTSDAAMFAADNGFVKQITNTMPVPTEESEIVNGVTIQFHRATNGRKICGSTWETTLNNLYTATGVAWYYIIDTTNQRFKLPRKHSTQIVESVVTSTNWHRLYADGWVEQGGIGTLVSSSYTANLPIEMANTDYFYSFNTTEVQVNTAVAGRKCTEKTTTSVTILGTYASGGVTNYDAGGVVWEVKGKAADLPNYQCDEQYLYFYVGQ